MVRILVVLCVAILALVHGQSKQLTTNKISEAAKFYGVTLKGDQTQGVRSGSSGKLAKPQLRVPTPEQVCQQMCTDKGNTGGKVDPDTFVCTCDCQYWACDADIPVIQRNSNFMASRVPKPKKPTTRLTPPICCGDESCAQMCTDAYNQLGSCDTLGNCQCKCPICGPQPGVSCEQRVPPRRRP